MFRGLTALAMAAAMAPFVFFGMLIVMMLGLASVTTGPLILAFIGWMMLNKWTRKEREREQDRERDRAVIEARIVRDAPQDYPAESYAPPAHFDLMLSAKHDIGRIRGAAGAIEDAAVARQFMALANEAEAIHARLLAEPVKLGLARRYFSSYLPRTADLAQGYHRLRKDGVQDRRTKLIDVLYRLEAAMKEQKESLSAPDLSRVDADIRILTQDLQPVEPSFTQSVGTARDRIDEIVKSAKKR
jgi:5-bromo-4-chloroindolyl phosphate hydrolysis protein